MTKIRQETFTNRLRSKGYTYAPSEDKHGDYWVAPDGLTRFYVDTIGIFFYRRGPEGWNRVIGRSYDILKPADFGV